MKKRFFGLSNSILLSTIIFSLSTNITSCSKNKDEPSINDHIKCESTELSSNSKECTFVFTILDDLYQKDLFQINLTQGSEKLFIKNINFRNKQIEIKIELLEEPKFTTSFQFALNFVYSNLWTKEFNNLVFVFNKSIVTVKEKESWSDNSGIAIYDFEFSISPKYNRVLVTLSPEHQQTIYLIPEIEGSSFYNVFDNKLQLKIKSYDSFSSNETFSITFYFIDENNQYHTCAINSLIYKSFRAWKYAYDVSDKNELLGFKFGITDDQIIKIFGDSLYIPPEIESIADNAFKNRPAPQNLTKLNFDKKSMCKSIGENAFINNTFSSIYIPAMVNKIASTSFINSTNLIEIDVDSENSTFSSRKSQHSETLNGLFDKGLTTLFLGSQSLKSLPESVTTIAKNAFYGQKINESFVFSTALTTIDEYAFAYTKFDTLKLSYSIKTINSFAFYKSNIPTFDFSNFTSIIEWEGEKIFECENDKGIIKIKYPSHETDWKKYFESFGFVFSDEKWKFSFDDGISLFDIDDSKKQIKGFRSTFSSDEILYVFGPVLVIPKDIISISDDAFNYDDPEKIKNFPNKIETFDFSPLSKCESIGRNAFSSVEIKNIKISSSVTSIYGSSFKKCPLENIMVDPNNPSYTSQNTNGDEINGLFSKDLSILVKGDKSTTIPNETTIIGDYAFYNQDLSSGVLSINNNITKIGEYSFANCSSITSLVLPKNVINLSNGSFYGCSQVVEIDLSDYTSVPENWMTLDQTFSDWGQAGTVYINNDSLKDKWKSTLTHMGLQPGWNYTTK